MKIPAARCRNLNDRPMRRQGRYILYWMVAHRRANYNYALERAVNLAVEWEVPLVILEALRVDYPWACDRFHAFILQGMNDNRRAFSDRSVTYYPYVETGTGDGRGLLAALSEDAVAVVSDDFPAFFLPRMQRVAAARLDVRLEVIDGNGILPMRGTQKMYKRAVDFRRYIHDQVMDDAIEWPDVDPLAGGGLAPPVELDEAIVDRWPMADGAMLQAPSELLSELSIDHDIGVNPEIPGGSVAARELLARFMEASIGDYHERRNELTERASSGLSPYLHFGHISPNQLFDTVCDAEDWSADAIDEDRRAKRDGFWGMSAGAEAYVEQFFTWRELGFNRCALDPEGYDRYETLPQWAKETLADHRDDRRPHLYELEEFEAAKTHDELWNAAQRQLVTTGTMHNYLRMLWGKKILHWTASPQEALDIMIELNNKYATDGRDPNSYSGIFWILGRFDRAWGPEREVFGKIRYMTSRSTRRKFNVDAYLQRYGEPEISA